ncbi:MAG: hypothetical protein ACLPZR_20075 [Solirubrobacteraceae bacterium]
MMPRARPRSDDRTTPSTLAPLRWIAGEDLIYDTTSRTCTGQRVPAFAGRRS